MKVINFSIYLVAFVFLTFHSSQWCLADTPHVFTFQGYATNAQGQPLQSDHQVAFAIYDSVTDGTLLWSEPSSTLTFTNGYFTKILGQVTPFPPDFFNPERWLQVTIEGQVLAPRERITSVPWSMETERVDSQQLYIHPSTGNVGIGTTNPTANLTIKGNLSRALTGIVGVPSGSTQVTGVGTLFSQELVIGDAIKIGGEVFTVSAIDSDTTLVLDSPHQAGAVNVTAFSDNNLWFVQNGDATSKIVIDKSGNVGIGTTHPKARLEVAGMSYGDIEIQAIAELNGSAQLGLDASASENGKLWRIESKPGGYLGFRNQSDGRTAMCLSNEGGVGIGTTNPNENLQVIGGIRTDYMRILENEKIQWRQGDGSNDDGAYIKGGESLGNYLDLVARGGCGVRINFWDGEGGLKIYDGGGYGGWGPLCVRNIQIGSAGNDVKSVWTASGNVGIGTTDPQYALDVNGEIRADNVSPGNILFDQNGKKTWKMYSNDFGLFLEDLQTGGSSRIFLEKDIAALKEELKREIIAELKNQ